MADLRVVRSGGGDELPAAALTRRCYKCRIDKPLTEFHKSRERKNGRTYRCKGCHHVAQTTPAHREWRNKYKKTARFKAWRRKYLKQRFAADPWFRWKANVRTLTLQAVQLGLLSKVPCEVCGAERVQAHHRDYRQPLAVSWLCKMHHLLAHRDSGL